MRPGAQPELGALAAVPQPDAQHMLAALDVDADAQVGSPVDHGALRADLDHQGVDVEDRVDRVERPGLRLVELLDDPVGDLGDQRRGHLHPIHAAQLPADVPSGETSGVEVHDVLVEPLEPAGVLRDELRLEAAVAIPRDVKLNGADVGQDRLRAGAVAVVARPSPSRVARLVAEMVGELLGQASLDQTLGEFGEHAGGPEQLQAAGGHAGHDRVDHLLRHRR